MLRLRMLAPVVSAALVCACQAVFGDFEVSPAPAEPPAEVLGFECEPGAYRCTGELLETCSDDRSGFITEEVCASAAECNLNAHTCRPCFQGERMCRGNAIEQCDAGAWVPETTCPTEALCTIAADRMSGVCATPACATAGAHRCDEGKLSRCSVGLDRDEVIALCASRELCDVAHANELGDSGARGACLPPACGPDAWSCDGAILRHCALDRTAWSTVGTCESPDLCSVAHAACTPCTPGEIECNGAELRRCTEAAAWQTLERCDSVALCDAQAGRCEAAECSTPGALRCASGGVPALEVCSDDRRWAVAEVCASVELCSVSAGRCLLPACAVGDARCRGNLHETCSADRTRFDVAATCAAGEVCDPAMGCAPGPCTEGTARCNGPSLERCTEGKYREERRCATFALCDATAGACTDPTCEAGSFICTGTILRKCLPGRNGVEGFLTCGQGMTCDVNPAIGTGLAQCDACTPNVYECSGMDLMRCSTDGQARVKVSSCPTGCSVTDGVPACG